ncbi:uncharacterized protein MYCFIDRAFT_171957 [Pseudocercospora fijiensis CIRAD86]|uniref:Uncharacterized protein n=1 Tax=Pseudocercospora fijiensis (strain CIRAD86) TaxID=383855 RepID=M2Z8Q2_PSEFD|nr:uncharacterized protein MYCFIDRAFT_171957 [Pseudocercospora fijiensis CIRAD86]EME86160.1 hypothetical protein MYCFIDRAFT_171957 [Pseudocercospora fijiensis CIRAD86]
MFSQTRRDGGAVSVKSGLAASCSLTSTSKYIPKHNKLQSGHTDIGDPLELLEGAAG